jgi:uncharacterized protein (DUF1800 family)
MKRRELLNKLLDNGNGKVLSLEKDTKPLDEVRANHLLRRLSYQPTIKEVNYYIGKSPEEVVDKLLGDGLDYLPENSSRLPDPQQNEDNVDMTFVGHAMQNPRSVPNPLSNSLEGQLNARYGKVVNWIISLSKREDLIEGQAREKLTHFLMGIWCIQFNYDGENQIPANSLYQNNQLLRKYRLGSYREIAKEMTLDGAMLLYQSAHLSRKEAPNENYARELMELFTMGIGNYSEGDIQEIAKIMTGWRTAPFLGDPRRNGYFQTWLDSDAHHTGSKRVMSIEFPALTEQENNEFKVKTNEIDKLIDGLFEIRDVAISKFICEKMIRFFVYSNPGDLDQSIIDELAQVMRDNDFNLLPVYKKLFTSTYFFSEANIGVQIKTPLEYAIGIQRLLNKDLANSKASLDNMEQSIYNPPDVSGWTGYRTWISTTTYPFRISYGIDLAASLEREDILNILDQVFNKQNPTEFLREMFLMFFSKDLESEYYDRYMWFLNQNNVTDENWITLLNNKDNKLIDNVKLLIEEMIKSPLFHLC